MDFQEIVLPVPSSIKSYFAIKIIDAHHIHELMREASSKFAPLPAHLKRIRKLPDTTLMLICSVDSAKIDDIKASFPFYEYSIVEIPSEKPRDKQEWKEMCLIWPMSYHASPKPTFPSRSSAYDFCEIGYAVIATQNGDVILRRKDDPSHPLGHAVMQAVAAMAESESEYYLLNTLDVYIYSEPCVMCCMALLHSRVHRVFLRKVSSNGGFSKIGIHCKKGLNHHFNVFLVGRKEVDLKLTSKITDT